MAPKKPSTRPRPPSPGGGAVAICQASTISHAVPTQRNAGSSKGRSSNAAPSPPHTTTSIAANPTAMPSMCGTVARMPWFAAEAAIITLFGPGVMYIATENPTSESSRLSMAIGQHRCRSGTRAFGAILRPDSPGSPQFYVAPPPRVTNRPARAAVAPAPCT